MGSPEGIHSVFSNHSPPLAPRQGLSLNWKLTTLLSLLHPQAPGIACLCSQGLHGGGDMGHERIWVMLSHAWLVFQHDDLDSGPQDYTTSEISHLFTGTFLHPFTELWGNLENNKETMK